jgi:type I restriction enzyme R subunit
MPKDPAFYKKFSRLLEEVLEAMHQKRMDSFEALEQLEDISTKVTTHTDEDVPAELKGNDMARRYFGCVRESVEEYTTDKKPGADIALRVVEKISMHKIRDWRSNPDALNNMRGEIDDVLFDIADEYGIEIPIEEHDAIIDRCIEVAIANED